jgi:hypothetical protein
VIAVIGAVKAVTGDVTAVTRGRDPGLDVTGSVPVVTTVASGLPSSRPPSSRASARRPSPSTGTRVPPPGCPASPACRLHYQPGPRLERAPSTALPGPPGAEPNPGASSTGKKVWLGAERRLDEFISQSPGHDHGASGGAVATALQHDRIWP